MAITTTISDKAGERSVTMNSAQRLLTVFGGNPLASRISAWQNIQTDLIHAGGLEQASWGAETAVNGGATGRTFIAPKMAFRQNGYLSQAIVSIKAKTDNAWKVKVFRYNSITTEFDIVGEQSFMPAVGANTINILPLIAVKTGDIPGLFAPNATNELNYKSITGRSDKYAATDITGSNAFSTAIASTTMEAEFLTTSPYLAFTGDSIAAGTNGTTNYFGGLAIGTAVTSPGGEPTSEIGLQLAVSVPVLRHQNLALGSKTFAWVASTGIVECIAVKPKTILIHCGINDVIAPRTWAAIEADLDTIKAAITTEKLLIDEILPSSSINDIQAAFVRTCNTNLSTWCNANGANLILCHDVMGKIRASTGELDDGADNMFAADGVHLSTLGVTKMAQIWKRYL